jgi:hypothetical protein
MRIPTWMVAVGSGVLGLALGAGVLSAQAQQEDDEPVPREALQAFAECAEEAGITLPDLRQHRREREPLGDDERAALESAREACGDLLPFAAEREAFRQCLDDAGVLGDEVTRQERREAVRACAEEQGIDRSRFARGCRPGRLRHAG